LTAGEAAKYIGVSKTFLDKLRTKGGGPLYVKLGQNVFYEVRELDYWIEEQPRFKSTADEIVKKREKIAIVCPDQSFLSPSV
jgi:hypothetical protein